MRRQSECKISPSMHFTPFKSLLFFIPTVETPHCFWVVCLCLRTIHKKKLNFRRKRNQLFDDGFIKAIYYIAYQTWQRLSSLFGRLYQYFTASVNIDDDTIVVLSKRKETDKKRSFLFHGAGFYFWISSTKKSDKMASDRITTLVKPLIYSGGIVALLFHNVTIVVCQSVAIEQQQQQ